MNFQYGYDLREKILLQYYKRMINANFEEKQILKNEFILRHQLNLLDENDYTGPESVNNYLKIVCSGISYLKKVTKLNHSNYLEKHKFTLESICRDLKSFLEDNLENSEDRYLYSQLSFFGHYLYPNSSRMSHNFLEDSRELLNELIFTVSPYQNKAQYFAWKYKILFTHPDQTTDRHKLLKDAAEGGHVRAQYEYGRYCEDLALEKQNKQKQQEHYDEALTYYKVVADQRNAKALFQLGGMYLERRGIPAFLPEEALIWYMKAAFV